MSLATLLRSFKPKQKRWCELKVEEKYQKVFDNFLQSGSLGYLYSPVSVYLPLPAPLSCPSRVTSRGRMAIAPFVHETVEGEEIKTLLDKITSEPQISEFDYIVQFNHGLTYSECFAGMPFYEKLNHCARESLSEMEDFIFEKQKLSLLGFHMLLGLNFLDIAEKEGYIISQKENHITLPKGGTIRKNYPSQLSFPENFMRGYVQ